LPLEVASSVIPKDSLQTPEKIALGEKLFFDGRLSANGTVACASCHQPRLAFTDGRQVAVGIDNRVGQRNSPTVLNALYNQMQFWDGRAATTSATHSPTRQPAPQGSPTIRFTTSVSSSYATTSCGWRVRPSRLSPRATRSRLIRRPYSRRCPRSDDS